ncbi:protein PHYTOCHROME KINASE SUBSTRATE 4-like [Coffea eugenioides]|uniref:protein PHYTOCHROME KINASE SUBSTRATE 4-like n=1 Tax=Coffea eugenioides TaxID=49369 RepID=UPI000F613A5C|nr:protein PHYTOCHROME KINASE SUBSTRATE 4-like [Coffea eugenioides]XP_027176193.1 protein PHYTOCHROME KINASE SUBSTRATE 4-like [Coffea eugenioides]
MDSSPTTISNTFKYNSPHQPIFNIVEAPFHHKSFAQSYTTRDASFSPYLKPKEPDRFPSQVVTSVADDTELNVFDAQKYFSESTNEPKESKGIYSSQSSLNHASEPSDAGWRFSSASSTVDGYSRNFQGRSFHATPTASSEASWNSQTGLLSNPPGPIPVSLMNTRADHDGGPNRGSSSAAKWRFCRKCPCGGMKSVQVDEGSSDHRSQAVNEDNHKNTKPDVYQKRQGHRSHDHEKMVEKISSMSQKSTVSDLDHSVKRHQTVSSNTSRVSLPSENHFIPTSVSQQRIPASGKAPFTDGAMTFSFPVLNPSYPFKPEQKGFLTTPKLNIPLDEPQRISLEVFRPSDRTISRKSIDQQRVALGAKTHGSHLDRRGNFAFPGSPMTGEDDVASDASSDLFEIESFSTQTTSYPNPMYRRRDSLDEASTFNARRLGGFYGTDGRGSLDEPMTPTTENYAPSEASIDWSVTTAEGFDRASVSNFSITASEIEDFSITRRRSLEKGSTRQAWSGGGGGSGDNSADAGKKKGTGLLLSCRHERAVSVGPHPLKFMPEGGPPLPLISTSAHVNSAASRPPKPNAPPLAKGHSAHLSLAFAA